MSDIEPEPTLLKPYLNQVSLDISIKSAKWASLGFNIHQYCQQIVNAVISHTIGDNNRIRSFIEISLLLADNKTLQNLNKKYKNKDKPTNVLSFPFLQNPKNEILYTMKSQNYTFLGDIAISYERVMEESLQQEKKFMEYFAYILIHGMLHLFKYDHITDEETEIMEKMEAEIIKLLSF